MSFTSVLPNLVHINIWNCEGCKHLPKIEQLPSLRELHLGGLTSIEYIDDYFSSGGPTGGGNELDNDESLMSSPFPSSSSRGGGGRRERAPPPPTTFFPSLKYLTLEFMPNLKGWWRMSKLAAAEDQELSLLPSFPCLIESLIRYCPKLTSMPLQPTVVKLELWEVREKLVQQQLLMKTKTTMVAATRSSSSSLVLPLSNLEELVVSVDQVTLPEAAFQRLTSIRKLVIGGCPRRTSLSRWMLHLTALRSLHINDCQEIDLSDIGDDNANLTSLTIERIPKLKSLPAGLLHFTTLQHLTIKYCENLMSLPEWIGSLTSLQQLYICDSPRLNSLPEGVQRLTTLQHLEIEFSSQELYDRCQEETEEDWPKIAHIPKVLIY
ncbi:disease resistance protein L6-like isoform X2 [Cornus florida]|uniref:disease resistance protein L6-like isoform X2 n=1 Tax=Cornus florida TaxID=4283 RepID=UPI00289A1714|nr:disease resistance protein L6-like isoform X2 [Cornus florida]XP_059641689.1 disease resistance protein L6-like isoform X2 [Cornus florida]